MGSLHQPRSALKHRTERVPSFTALHAVLSGLACTLLFAASASAEPASYYVSPTGANDNDGSYSHPWNTIGYAATVVLPGDTVHVAPGTYAESVAIKVSGADRNRIRFVSDSQWGAKVIGDGSSNDAFMVSSDYVDIVGFEVTNTTGYIGIELFGSYDRAVGNHVHDVWANGCVDGLGGAGIASSLQASYPNPYSSTKVGTHNAIEDNHVHDIGNSELGCALVHGVYIMNAYNTVIGNVTYGNMGWGITSWHSATNDLITKNTVFENNTGGINTGSNDAGGDDYSTVMNNRVFDNGKPPHGWIGGSPNPRFGIGQEGIYGIHNVFTNNVVYGNQPADYRPNVFTH